MSKDLENLQQTPVSNFISVQRCAVSLPRRRARAKNPKKAEKSGNAMREGDGVVCIVPPLSLGLLHSRGSRTSIMKLLTIWPQKFHG